MKRPTSLSPLSDAEMRDMWRRGDAFADIAAMARRRNGLTRAQVREVVFGEGVV